MENRTPIKIGKDTFYIGFAGVDRKTGEVVTEIAPRPLDQGKDERTALFAKALGLTKKKKAGAV
ncbi:MAG: hypothetical protein FWE91_08875 [Defluviitaleaceae bacterium]|nr:hypothetical protein [Defluviitaleaceae bacterium]MCL2836043.1 hypothetical protein [Defluviitaleaceae bacterium]